LGKRSKGRLIDGIFLLDKPQGITSNAALQKVKRLFNAAKAGHTGALDPLATGLLPITLGEATKFSQVLLDSDKRYRTTAKLGIRTNSSDADGEVVETKPVPESLTKESIDALLQSRFQGEIEQVPSMFSALKFNGQPLYKLARKGVEVEVKPRQVTVYSIELLDFRGDEIDLEVYCSKGTYIRSIVEDLGLELGCGAHVSMLRRLQTGAFTADQMLTLDQLTEISQPKSEDESVDSIQTRLDALLLPPWAAIEDKPLLVLPKAESDLIRQGRMFPVQFEPSEMVRLHEEDTDVFLGIGRVDEDGVLKPTRLLSSQVRK
jgi:tRNA pseudouridine55 synthase